MNLATEAGIEPITIVDLRLQIWTLTCLPIEMRAEEGHAKIDDLRTVTIDTLGVQLEKREEEEGEKRFEIGIVPDRIGEERIIGGRGVGVLSGRGIEIGRGSGIERGIGMFIGDEGEVVCGEVRRGWEWR